MPWIEYHTQLRDHWKIQRLADELSTDYVTALGSMSCLWLWCVEYAPDGNVTRFKDEELRRGARVVLIKFSKKLLSECELIDKRGHINDWSKHGLKYLTSTRKRVREYRKRVTLQKRNGNVTVTPTLPYLTVPNQEKLLDSNYLKKDNINNLIRLMKGREGVKNHLIGLGFSEHDVDEALGKKH